MLYPNRYMSIINVLEKVKIIHPRTGNFVRNSLDTHESREMVYNTWQCLRFLDPDIQKVQKIINEKDLNIHLFFGKYDKVIPPFIGKKFVKGLRKNNSLHILDAGHQLIKEKTNADLEKILSA